MELFALEMQCNGFHQFSIMELDWVTKLTSQVDAQFVSTPQMVQSSTVVHRHFVQ